MLDILFGWRKASKCKKQIRRLRRRLKLLMNKRGSMVRQSRQDVAQLLKLGYDEAALHRAEVLFKDESIMAVYELLDHFCEFILFHMPHIRRSKDCPNDINEVVSSLIYASARCGDLPELLVIRELFGQHYGQRLATAALELFPGNLVNPLLKEHLNVQSVPEYVKHKLVDEITLNYCLQPEILAIEYPSELTEDELLVEDRTDEIQESQVGALNRTTTDRKSMHVGSSSSSKNSFSTASHSREGTDTTSTSVASSIAHQSSPGASESPVHNQVDEEGNFTELDKQDKSTISDLETKETQRLDKSYNTNPGSKEERVTSSSSSQSSVQFLEETVVYLDDVEEYQSFIPNTGDIQDQRLFKFKFSMLEKIGTSKGCNKQSDGDEYQSTGEELRGFTSKGRSSGEKSRRSVSRENYFMNDIDCAHYYGELSHENSEIPKHQYSRQKKLQKMTTPPQQREPFDCSPNQQKQPCCRDTGTTPLPKHLRRDLNHNTDCYMSRNSEKGDLGTPMRKILDNEGTLTARRSFPEKQTQDKVQGIHTPESCSSRSKDHCEINKSSTRKEMQPPYTRAITMPLKRNKDSSKGKMTRSNTCLSPHPNHVHPKLPDYDDLASKFLAFKKSISGKRVPEGIACYCTLGNILSTMLNEIYISRLKIF